MSNGQVWEICREIDSHSANGMHYPKCKKSNKKETYTEKTIRDNNI